MRNSALLLLLGIGIMLPHVAAAQHGRDTAIIVCESVDFRRAFCPADTDLGVRLVRQTSTAECIRGRTWWRDARGVVVTEGCRGEFEVGYRETAYQWAPSRGGGGYVRPERLLCRSNDYQRRYCPADIGYGAAALVRQLSESSCVYGRSWAYDRRGIWVDDGCSAEFEIGYTDNQWQADRGATWVRCESRSYAQEFCAAPGNREVRLARQVSRSSCIEGQSWGYDRRGIWVTHGCAGDFEIR